MNFLISILRKVAQLPVIYAVSLLLQLFALWAGWEQREWSLRGGLWSLFFVEMLAIVVSIGAIVQTWRSHLNKLAKFGLTLVQGAGVGLVSLLIIRILPIMPFLLLSAPGACTITSNSPSGQHSITIESACFMGCTHTVFSNAWMLERNLGEVTLSNGRFCNSNPTFTWNQAETQVKWQVRDENGTIKL
jgi:hypothetical protein